MEIPEPQIITTDDLRVRGRELMVAFRQNLRWMLPACVLAGLAAGAYAFLKSRSYEASLRFVVAEDSDGQLGGISSLLGQFGFGGAGLGQRLNLNKVVELAGAEIILDRVLYQTVDSTYPVPAGLPKPTIRDILVDSLDLGESLAERVERLRSRTALTPAVETEVVDLVLIEMLGGGREKRGLIESQFDSDSGIITLSVVTGDGDVSLAVMRALYRELDRYYVRQRTAQERRSLDILNGKLDSIRQVIRRTDNRIAAIRDQQQAVLLKARSTELTVLNREQSINTLIYGELLKNKSAAEFILATKTPSFELVSASRYPLEPRGRGLVKAVLIASVLTGLLCGIYLLVSVAFTP